MPLAGSFIGAVAISTTDVVMMGCPLTDETYHLIGEEELGLGMVLIGGFAIPGRRLL